MMMIRGKKKKKKTAKHVLQSTIDKEETDSTC